MALISGILFFLVDQCSISAILTITGHFPIPILPARSQPARKQVEYNLFNRITVPCIMFCSAISTEICLVLFIRYILGTVRSNASDPVDLRATNAQCWTAPSAQDSGNLTEILMWVRQRPTSRDA